MGLGVPEIVIIAVVVMLIFGPKRLPSLGKDLGAGIKNFKAAFMELKPKWADEDEKEEVKEKKDE